MSCPSCDRKTSAAPVQSSEPSLPWTAPMHPSCPAASGHVTADRQHNTNSREVSRILGSAQNQRISLSMYDSNDILCVQNHSTPQDNFGTKSCILQCQYIDMVKRDCAKMTKSRKYCKGGVRGRGKPTWGAGMLSLLE